MKPNDIAEGWNDREWTADLLFALDGKLTDADWTVLLTLIEGKVRIKVQEAIAGERLRIVEALESLNKEGAIDLSGVLEVVMSPVLTPTPDTSKE